jgi:ribosomal protein L44E
MDVDELIDIEVKMYVDYCEKASEHDVMEDFYRKAAHNLFYHIQELRSTRKLTTWGRFTYPISK